MWPVEIKLQTVYFFSLPLLWVFFFSLGGLFKHHFKRLHFDWQCLRLWTPVPASQTNQPTSHLQQNAGAKLLTNVKFSCNVWIRLKPRVMLDTLPIFLWLPVKSVGTPLKNSVDSVSLTKVFNTDLCIPSPTEYTNLFRLDTSSLLPWPLT